MIRVSLAPSSSSSARTCAARSARSPESIRTAPSVGSGHLDGGADRRGDVVGVDQQRGPRAERVDLGRERGPLAVVQQHEGVRAGAAGRHAPALAGPQVGGAVEARDVRRPGARHRGLLVGAARAHLDARAARRRPSVIRDAAEAIAESWLKHAQRQRLEQHRLAERRLDGQHRRAGEVGLALGVAPHVPAEPVPGQPLEGRLVDDAGRAAATPARRGRSGSRPARRGTGRCPRPRRSAARPAASARTARRPPGDPAVPERSAACSMVSS